VKSLTRLTPAKKNGKENESSKQLVKKSAIAIVNENSSEAETATVTNEMQIDLGTKIGTKIETEKRTETETETPIETVMSATKVLTHLQIARDLTQP
jgi:hypothetical protein